MELNKKSAQGVGTLIIFIALILVAAIAASVLIQTSSSLQSKSLDVGKDTQGKISNMVNIVKIRGENASDNVLNGGAEDTMFVLVQLEAGSEDIRLSDLIVTVNTEEGIQTLIYTDGAASETSFNETYISGTPSSEGYITRSDLVELNIPLLNDIIENEQVQVQVIHKDGGSKAIDFSAPNVMRVYNQDLYN